MTAIPEVIATAQARMAPGLWEYTSGGAESGATIRRNRAVLHTIAFRTRIFAQREMPGIATKVLGQEVASPVLLAPVGSLSLYDDLGAVAAARAAHRRGTLASVGTLAWPSLEEVAAQSDGPLLFQIYVRGDRAWLTDTVKRAEAAGYVGFVLTADSSGTGKRRNDVGSRYRLPDLPHPNLPAGQGAGSAHQMAFTWADLAVLRAQTSLPLAVKGILSAADAALAVDHGVDAVYVSNHGGRDLDHLPATLEVLPEIVEAVEGRAEVLVDGGILRGSDVVKALAMGARAVLIGKLQAWALAAGGVDGLVATLSTLDDEIRHTLRLLGVADIGLLRPEHLRPTLPTDAAERDLL
jgi:isopentenyl diphosphate isomerase/L-lactate dehydrogenase-like FMN-dependent dehydrogenase